MSSSNPAKHPTRSKRGMASPPPRVESGLERPPCRVGARSALYVLTLSLLSLAAPVWSADPQSSLAIFQHLLETAPGEYELRALSLSAASGSEATATVTTFTDPDGKVRMGVTAAAAGEGVSSESPFTILAPEGWTVETQVGEEVSSPP